MIATVELGESEVLDINLAQESITVTKKPLEDRATGWISGIAADAPELEEVRKALIGSRGEMMDTVKDIGLPFIPYAYSKVDDFLDHPEALAKDLDGKRFFYLIQPADYACGVESPPHAVSELDTIVDVAREYTSTARGRDFIIMLSEVRDIVYVGNVVVDEHNRMYGELTDEGIPPTRGGVTRLFSFRKDDTLDVFRYEFDDSDLRSAVYSAVNALPHIGSGRERRWDPGYYEYHLVRSPSGRLTPVFYDYRQSKEFLFVPNEPTGQ